jgi:TolB-like protein/class 3 adenylate cyclase
MAAEVNKEIELEIAYVLFIDIVGYSKLVTSEQRRLLELLNRIVHDSEHFRKAEANSRLVTVPTGDGMALVFYNTPEAPVECALEISSVAKEHPELKLRMGLHSGPVSGVVDVSGGANIAGAGINIAQRVMDCGDAAHILVSKHMAEDLEQYGHWKRHLHELGEIEVKHGARVAVVNLYTEDLGNPEVPQKFRQARKGTAPVVADKRGRRWIPAGVGVLLAALIIGGLLWSRHRATTATNVVNSLAPTGSSATPTAAIPDKSIAVMPFENLSEDKANAYFADGIQDEILTRLSKIADLKVISRTSTQHYKSAPENLPEIANQLRVAHILEGSVQKSGDAVRVNVQLIKAANDSHLWADTFDRKLTDIFSVESDIAKTIADQLRVHLSGREEQVITAKPTDNTQAYDAYLRGLPTV